MSTHAALIL